VYDFFKELIILNIEDGNTLMAYNAFFFLSILTRREKDYLVFDDLMSMYYDVFKVFSTFSHLVNVYYLTVGIPKDKYKETLDSGLKNFEKFKNHSGVIHCFSDIVATIYEDVILSNDLELLNDVKQNYLEKAIESIDYAIFMSQSKKYAKYYCTKGRLIVLSGDLKQGKKLINTAISYEDKTNRSKIDYYTNKLIKSDLIALYSLFFNKIDQVSKDLFDDFGNKITTSLSDVDQKLAKTSHDFDEKMSANTIKNMEVLTFFTGLIGFLVSSISIAVNSSNLVDAYSLIIIIFGSFLATFSSMDWIIKAKTDLEFKKYWPNLISIILGVIIVGAIYFIR